MNGKKMRILDRIIPIISHIMYTFIIFMTGLFVGANCFPRVETVTEIIEIQTTPYQDTKSKQISNNKSLGEYELTAYCPCKKCCGKTNGITSSGVKATAGRTIACDKAIPFGTKLIINGKEYVCEDRGGAVKGKRIDIFFNTHQEALNFGRQRAEVFIRCNNNY